MTPRRVGLRFGLAFVAVASLLLGLGPGEGAYVRGLRRASEVTWQGTRPELIVRFRPDPSATEDTQLSLRGVHGAQCLGPGRTCRAPHPNAKRGLDLAGLGFQPSALYIAFLVAGACAGVGRGAGRARRVVRGTLGLLAVQAYVLLRVAFWTLPGALSHPSFQRGLPAWAHARGIPRAVDIAQRADQEAGLFFLVPLAFWALSSLRRADFGPPDGICDERSVTPADGFRWSG